MALNRIKIGDVISVVDEKNKDNFDYPFFGININKEFMPSVANTSKVDKRKYKIVRKNRFVFSGMQTGRDNCIRIGIFTNEKPVLVSPAYTTFEIASDKIIPLYFFMIFNSKEKDRYGAFLSDSSVRSNLDWDRFCDIELEVPPIEIQKKYVAIYEGMLANLRSYEKGLDDLLLVCESYIERLRKKYPSRSILPFLNERNEKNTIELDSTYLHGVGKEGFICPKQERRGDTLSKCNVFRYHDFVYNPSVLYAGAIALNFDYEVAICTEEYVVFHIKDETVLRPEYLFLWIKRDECGRFIDFSSVDSVRNRVYFGDLSMIKIPVPSIEKQNYVSELFNAYNNRKIKCKELKRIISDICPTLVRGSILESSKMR